MAEKQKIEKALIDVGMVGDNPYGPGKLLPIRVSIECPNCGVVGRTYLGCNTAILSDIAEMQLKDEEIPKITKLVEQAFIALSSRDVEDMTGE